MYKKVFVFYWYFKWDQNYKECKKVTDCFKMILNKKKTEKCVTLYIFVPLKAVVMYFNLTLLLATPDLWIYTEMKLWTF